MTGGFDPFPNGDKEDSKIKCVIFCLGSTKPNLKGLCYAMENQRKGVSEQMFDLLPVVEQT